MRTEVPHAELEVSILDRACHFPSMAVLKCYRSDVTATPPLLFAIQLTKRIASQQVSPGKWVSLFSLSVKDPAMPEGSAVIVIRGCVQGIVGQNL
jgi:hypothetical protein